MLRVGEGANGLTLFGKNSRGSVAGLSRWAWDNRLLTFWEVRFEGIFLNRPVFVKDEKQIVVHISSFLSQQSTVAVSPGLKAASESFAERLSKGLGNLCFGGNVRLDLVYR